MRLEKAARTYYVPRCGLRNTKKRSLIWRERAKRHRHREREHFCNAYFDDFELFAAILR